MTRRIIVGIDGSLGSKQALAWALDEARVTGASLRVLYAWLPPIPPAAFDAATEHAPDVDFSAEAKASLARFVAEVAGETHDVPIAQEVVLSTPANMLIRASHEADLLVVGARGVGGFHGLLLGSVSQQCMQHAACPVVVVPDDGLRDVTAASEEDR